jgi:hydroxymethylpyrimidine pyrophosphatase-like HAD family hydrolase
MKQFGADRLVVFGDNNNDLPMFRIADESYAVSNAIPAVLAAATGVIGSHDNDVVARWITDDFRRS